MRHRSFAVRTRCVNVTFAPNVDSQNFVGAFSSAGHSINSHSSGTLSFAAWRSCAERTLMRAKREERTSFVPSRQRIVLQLLFGSEIGKRRVGKECVERWSRDLEKI